jgi:hypothetical protein
MGKTRANTKKIHGGARKGAGRKPASDPKVPVTIYVEESIIKAVGGIDQLRQECYDFLKKI